MAPNRIRLESDGTISLHNMEAGKFSSLVTGTYTTAGTVTVKVKIAYDATVQTDRFKVWVDGGLKLNTTDSTHAAGGALSGDKPRFNDLKIGYDNNGDNDIDDAGDDLIRSEDYESTQVTVTHDDAGNLVDDGTFRYVYDAWNRLVKVQSSQDGGAVTVQTAEFDATGRRMKKVVTNSGDFDGTVYLYGNSSAVCKAGRRAHRGKALKHSTNSTGTFARKGVPSSLAESSETAKTMGNRYCLNGPHCKRLNPYDTFTALHATPC